MPPHEALRLLAVATGNPVDAIRTGVPMDREAVDRFTKLVEQRISGEPLQYLEGEVPFGPVTIAVDRRVLIPRPETEYLYDLVVKSVAPAGVVVDLCTGSGALALALKWSFPEARVIASDLSAEALTVAEANGDRLGLAVEWRRGDIWSAVPGDLRGHVGLMVANPPYVSEREWSLLPYDVRQEPRMALVSGPTGTEVIERLLDETPVWLETGGVALVEVGDGQAGFLAERWDEVEIIADQFDRPRFLKLGRPIASS